MIFWIMGGCVVWTLAGCWLAWRFRRDPKSIKDQGERQ